jgi:indolepyruvate ferredoxin oxidoreductase, beta subunit
MPPSAITIAILAMGGEGGGVLADWIVDLAEHGGYCAQATSVPGVAQRTGSTIYYIEIFPEEEARAAGQEPVLALMPVPGEVDIVIASELMEAGRAVQRGLVTPGRTTLIASTHRVYSMTERTAEGDGRVDSAILLEAGRTAARHFVSGDFAAIAQRTGSVISAVLFGALAGSAALPFPREQFEDAIRRGGVGVDSSLDAFRSGACSSQPSQPDDPPASDCDAILEAGIQRLTDYQDARYAQEYVERLAPIRGITLLRETARYLALWMSYEDAIRVADLKIRAERFARIHREARTAPGQLLKIHDYVYPRAGEIADILPAALGRWLLSNRLARTLVERLTRKGQILETTSLRGFLKLRLLAGMRRWRRKSLRFQREQEAIDEWLAATVAAAECNYALACEVAQAPRLIKGYGDTHAQGMRAYQSAMAALPELLSLEDATARFRKLVIIDP